MTKKTFIMYQSWGEAISNMTDEQAGQFLKAIYALESDETGTAEDPADPALAIVWPLIKQKLIEDIDAYEETCRKRSEAGRHGNNKRWGESQKVANDRNCDFCDKNESQKVANVADYEYESDNESDKDISPHNPPMGAREDDPIGDDAAITGQFHDKELGRKFVNWMHVRQTLPGGFPYGSMVEAIKRALAAEVRYGPEKCKTLVSKSIDGTYRAIPWESLGSKKETARSGTKPGFTDFQQNDYDFDAIEKAVGG